MDFNNATNADIQLHQDVHGLVLLFLKDELLKSEEYTPDDYPSLKKDEIISTYEYLYSIFEDELKGSTIHF
ncbi:hypothetical protein QI202_00375 [Staphylococcus saprophyticus]|uniref:hypothetical protein n=1 Tax=Staphylococcus saprophyticus TaxID=29385 RepID=UPI00115EA047|nr:hypothetical protein [Staphylococcus saprophyticus]MDW3922277.1 hypothetical protein [Staphylococcus saprophyticus]MDW4018918.1 hypothetical protein [Staphylococcus saprophyticus]MDW4026478.1 hypothetical protein [Staphylococcus saprophyticus]MDW4150238.1 hypothetical protein [Staphylococcus saprophyticus]MDW4264039.1 hypothetical protein [Staphylococcus saprophyticus]